MTAYIIYYPPLTHSGGKKICDEEKRIHHPDNQKSFVSQNSETSERTRLRIFPIKLINTPSFRCLSASSSSYRQIISLRLPIMKLPSWDGFVDLSPLLADYSDSEVSSFQNSNESRLNNSDDNASQECGDSSSYNHVDDNNHNEVLSYHNVATTWLHPYSSTKLYIHDLSENFTAKFVSWLAITIASLLVERLIYSWP